MNEYMLKVKISTIYNAANFNRDTATKAELDAFADSLINDPSFDTEERAYLVDYVPQMVYTKVILVGRHTSDLPAYIKVVSTENILWNTSRAECGKQLWDLHERAKKQDAGLLFQNIPGILAATMFSDFISAQGRPYYIQVGIIISVPGPRLAGVKKEWTIPQACYADGSGCGADEMREIVSEVVNHANGRAKFDPSPVQRDGYTADGFSVTVDPVSEFKFSHIEWL